MVVKLRKAMTKEAIPMNRIKNSQSVSASDSAENKK